jgi:hypothetical protein
VTLFKLENDAHLEKFFATLPPVPYVMEEFITGDICSYDAILNSSSEPLIESMTVFPTPIMDIVIKHLDLSYYVAAHMPEKLRKMGRATAKAFGI